MDLTCPSIITERATLYIRHTQFDLLYFKNESKKKIYITMAKGVYNAKIIVVIKA